ncbi:TPA: hypothetical protein ACVOZE_004416 [Vibrio diabolicus]
MTQNIEQRTLEAVTKYESAVTTVDEIAHADKDIDTQHGKRKSFPKISREWNDESQRLQREWQNDSAVIRENWQAERNELSIKALGIKVWEPGQSEADINQQRRWTDNHTYLPKTVPVVMAAEGPDDNWIPYTADKSDTLNDVFGRKPVDLIAGVVLVPDANQQYPKLNALGKVWELEDSDVQITVDSFSESSDGFLVITLNDSNQVIAWKVEGASRAWVKAKNKDNLNSSSLTSEVRSKNLIESPYLMTKGATKEGVGGVNLVRVGFDEAAAGQSPYLESGRKIYPDKDGNLFARHEHLCIDAREFGLTSASINSPELLVDAIKECHELGRRLYIAEQFNFGDSQAIVDFPCEIDGNGSLNDLLLTIGDPVGKGDLWCRLNNFQMSSTAKDGPHGIELRRGRFFEMKGMWFKNVEKCIKGTATSDTAFHSIGLITVEGINALSVSRMLSLELNGQNDKLPFNDVKFINNRGWFLRQFGMMADQLDGLQYQGNLSHFSRNTPTALNHLRVKNAEWINIGSGNTYFEGGSNAIKLLEIGMLSMCGSNLAAFCGQNEPSSALYIWNNDKFLNAHIDGLTAEKPTKHLVEINAPAGLVQMGDLKGVIDDRVEYDETTNSNGHYFGNTPLDSIDHRAVWASDGVDVLVSPNTCRHIKKDETRHHLRNLIPGSFQQHSVPVRNAADAQAYASREFSSAEELRVFKLTDTDFQQNAIDGLLFITIKNVDSTSSTNNASYILHASKSPAGINLELISKKGMTGGSAANWPSFTFAFDDGGHLTATPFGATEGVFHFYGYAIGNVVISPSYRA